ncbi:MAG TPA: homoserine kinase, partial [Gemmatimonadaceae bacterium]|nr:homoserine kinase [Gemmatimonadaceae bacterium]
MASDKTSAHARVYAPGGIGNMGPGLDILGCALTGRGDVVELAFSDEPSQTPIRILEPGSPELSSDPARHAAAIAAMAVLRTAHVRPQRSLVMQVTKGLPLAGGQGGSAASAVAGAVAMNTLLGAPLDERALLAAALDAEATVAGRHADNVAPALMGGVVLVRSIDPLDVVRLPFPTVLRVVLVQPEQRLRTAESRAVLPASIDRAVLIQQSANIAAMVAAFASGDLDLLRRALDDRIAEPVRASLLPGFSEAKAAALATGAVGCSISGAGPTSFAFAPDDPSAARIASAMCAAYESRGVQATARLERI